MRATLDDEIHGFLTAHGPSTAPEIAIGVRARRDEVDEVLAGDGYARVPAPAGGSPRAAYFISSQPVLSSRRGKKNRAALLLEVLSDGREHSRREIFEQAGGFFLINNAASELRRAGYDVRQRVMRKGVYVYWINQDVAA